MSTWNKPISIDDADSLIEHCKRFFEKNGIFHEEGIYQNDQVSLNSPEFLEGIGEIIGYPEYEEDEDDEI